MIGGWFIQRTTAAPRVSAGIARCPGRAAWVAALLLFISADIPPDTVVAEFGPHRITLREYRLAYREVVKNPGVFDSPKVREEFLDDLVAGRLLAAEAERRGWHEDDPMRARVSAYHDRCLRRAHFDTVIKPRIRIQERDVEEAYQYTQEQRRLKHLFFSDPSAADSAYGQLQRGAAWDELARRLFTDTALAHSGGDLGWVTWDQLDYDVGITAFRLRPNVVSRVVESTFGYHILKVTDFKKNPLITRQQYEERRRKTRYLLEYKMADMEAYRYVKGLLSRATVRLHPEVLDFVRAKLANQFTRQPSAADQFSDLQLKEEEIRVLEMTLWDARDEEMATVNGEDLTVGFFIGALQYIPYAVVRRSFRAALDYAIRDFLITGEARGLGLERAPDVILQTRLFREYQAQLAFRRELVRNVTAGEDELRQYYESHGETFRSVPYDSVRAFIQDAVLTEKQQRVVPALVKELVGEATVTKHMDIINRYYDDLLNAPR